MEKYPSPKWFAPDLVRLLKSWHSNTARAIPDEPKHWSFQTLRQWSPCCTSGIWVSNINIGGFQKYGINNSSVAQPMRWVKPTLTSQVFNLNYHQSWLWFHMLYGVECRFVFQGTSCWWFESACRSSSYTLGSFLVGTSAVRLLKKTIWPCLWEGLCVKGETALEMTYQNQLSNNFN